MATLQENARKAIRDIYASRGYPAAKATAIKLVSQCETWKLDSGKRNQIKGEIAEAILECALEQAQRVISPSLIVKNLCIKAIDGKSTAEMDVTFCTAGRIYMFECKSHIGDKVLTGECTVNQMYTLGGKAPSTVKKEWDIAAQSKHHMRILEGYLRGARRRNYEPSKQPQSPYKLVLFQLSGGNMVDEREERYQRSIPALTLSSVGRWLLNDYSSCSCDIWDMQRVSSIVAALHRDSKRVLQAHIKALSSRE